MPPPGEGNGGEAGEPLPVAAGGAGSGQAVGVGRDLLTRALKWHAGQRTFGWIGTNGSEAIAASQSAHAQGPACNAGARAGRAVGEAPVRAGGPSRHVPVLEFCETPSDDGVRAVP